jgi:hypothetical protein
LSFLRQEGRLWFCRHHRNERKFLLAVGLRRKKVKNQCAQTDKFYQVRCPYSAQPERKPGRLEAAMGNAAVRRQWN